MEAHHRKMRDIEHVLAAQPGIARRPAGVDGRRIDGEIDVAGVVLGIDDDRPVHAAEAAALRRQSEMTDREFRRRQLGIDAIGVGRRGGDRAVREREHRGGKRRNPCAWPIRGTLQRAA